MRSYVREYNDDDDEDEFFKDGEKSEFPMMFTDAALFQETKSICDERNAMRNLSPEERRIADGYRKLEDEREAYRKRISNAWRGPSQADHDCLDEDFDDSPEAQRERYIKRISNAWRAGP